MAKRRTTYGKLERDRAKKAKAAATRARREGRVPLGEEGELDEDVMPEPVGPTLPQEEVLARLAEAHERFEAGEMSFEDFEETKAALLELIEVS
jgi:hypothetical protein